MKRTTKLIAVLAVTLSLILSLVSCGGSTYTYDYDLTEYITLGEYKGIEYDKIVVDITDEDVMAEIDSRLEAASTTEIVSTGTTTEEDTINVDFEGKIDGEVFEGGSMTAYNIDLDVDQMIDGFIEGLIGVDAGETVVLDLAFPDDYHSEDVAGKDVEFTVKINGIVVPKVPELDMDFVEKDSDGEHDSIESYKEGIKEYLTAREQEEKEYEQRTAIWEKIVAGTEILSYPTKDLSSRTEDLIDQYTNDASMYGITYEEYIQQAAQMEVEEFESTTLKDIAEASVAQDMIVYQIAKLEDIDVTEKEYTEYLDTILADSGFTRDTFEESMGMKIEEYAQMMNWKTSLLWEKVLDKVISYGVEQ